MDIILQADLSHLTGAQSESSETTWDVQLGLEPYDILSMEATMVPGDMYGDTGCVRSVSGPKGHQQIQECFQAIGVKGIKIERNKENFKFGDGKVVRSLYSMTYPCVVQGKLIGSIDIAYVECPCPPLLSRQVMTIWKADMSFDQQAILIKKHDLVVPFRKGEPYINIAEFDGKSKEELEIPEVCWIEDSNV